MCYTGLISTNNIIAFFFNISQRLFHPVHRATVIHICFHVPSPRNRLTNFLRPSRSIVKPSQREEGACLTAMRRQAHTRRSSLLSLMCQAERKTSYCLMCKLRITYRVSDVRRSESATFCNGIVRFDPTPSCLCDFCSTVDGVDFTPLQFFYRWTLQYTR